MRLSLTVTALEDLIASLRSHLTRLTRELEENKTLVATLREKSDPQSPRRDPSIRYAPLSDVAALRSDVERLEREVERLGSVVEEGLEERKRGRGEHSLQIEKQDPDDLVSLPAALSCSIDGIGRYRESEARSRSSPAQGKCHALKTASGELMEL